MCRIWRHVLNLGVAAAVTLAAARSAGAQVVDHYAGFAGQTDLTLNGSASINGTYAQLTPALGDLAGTFYTTNQIAVGVFQTEFTFHLLTGSAGYADGMGFCIQRAGPNVVGGLGGALGYLGIPTSIFIKFDNYPGPPGATSTTQIYQNGADPIDAGSIDLQPTISWFSQRDFRCRMNYDGATLTVTIRDLTSGGSLTQTYAVDIPTVIGGAMAHVGFTGATGGENAIQEVLTWAYSTTPSPTGLTATPGTNQVGLNWAAVAGASGYRVFRGTASVGPFAQIATPAGTSYLDTGAMYPNTYYYVVRAVVAGVSSINSLEAMAAPLPVEVEAIPNTGLQTNESGATTAFDVIFNQPAPAGGSTVTLTSSLPAEGLVSSVGNPAAATIMIPVPAGFTGAIPITLTGQDDPFADGPIPYTVSITATGFPGLAIPPVQATNNDNDAAGITINRVSGLVTSEAGAADTFTVVLNTQPFAAITLALSSSNTAEGLVSPAGLTFTPTAGQAYDPGTGSGGWNVAHTVTVTGVDDLIDDLNVMYTIVTGTLGTSDVRDGSTYGTINPSDVSVRNNDNDVAGVTIGPISGLVTSEAGVTDFFTVALNTQPFAAITLALSSSNPAEGTVSPATLTFTPTAGQAYNPITGTGGWNVAHTVTVTGVDDPAVDFDVAYTIWTGALVVSDIRDGVPYGAINPSDVSVMNLGNDPIPPTPKAWGSCGLLGLEAVLPLLLLAVFRRRRGTNPADLK